MHGLESNNPLLTWSLIWNALDFLWSQRILVLVIWVPWVAHWSSGSAYMDSKVTSLLPQPWILWICNMQQEGFELWTLSQKIMQGWSSLLQHMGWVDDSSKQHLLEKWLQWWFWNVLDLFVSMGLIVTLQMRMMTTMYVIAQVYRYVGSTIFVLAAVRW
jgi:hypothetical protein